MRTELVPRAEGIAAGHRQQHTRRAMDLFTGQS